MRAHVTVYKGKDKKNIHSVDVGAWLQDGWKLEKDTTELHINEELVKDVIPLVDSQTESKRKTLKLEKDITANDR